MLEMLNILIVFISLLFGGFMAYVAREEVRYIKPYLRLFNFLLGFAGSFMAMFFFSDYLLWFLFGLLVGAAYKNIFLYIGILLLSSLQVPAAIKAYSLVFIFFALSYGLLAGYDINPKIPVQAVSRLFKRAAIMFLPLIALFFGIQNNIAAGIGSGGFLISLLFLFFHIKNKDKF